MKKKIMILLCLLAGLLLPAVAMAADSLIITESTTVNGGDYPAGIYIQGNKPITVTFKGNVSTKMGIRISNTGGTTLVLADGAKVTADASNYYGSAGVDSGRNPLVITCEHAGQKGHACTTACGSLNATGHMEGGAGIGSGLYSSCANVTIKGGNITATGGGQWRGGGENVGGAGIGAGCYGRCENIVIDGGNIAATGKEGAAGIGGGHGNDAKGITINGGRVIATGGSEGAGIGGGKTGEGSDITINDGYVEATGDYGAGIGGGGCNGAYTAEQNHGRNITFNGGTVKAQSVGNGAAIGGGVGGGARNITINGGHITASAKRGGSAVGSGMYNGNNREGDSYDCYIHGGMLIAYGHTQSGGGRPVTICFQKIVFTGGEVKSYTGIDGGGAIGGEEIIVAPEGVNMRMQLGPSEEYFEENESNLYYMNGTTTDVTNRVRYYAYFHILPENVPSLPQTGDATPLWLLCAASLLSLAAACAAVRRMRRASAR